jgi:hypothetical protein
MILLKQLLEAKAKTTDFSAISKKTGKMVYFDTKDSMDTAVKAGTHDTSKIKRNDTNTSSSSDLFKGDYEKERGGVLDTEKEKSTENNASEEIIKGIKNMGYGSYAELYRKNKNGKLVQDVKFTRENITPELIKKVADDEGIDLNLLMKYGLNTTITKKFDTLSRGASLVRKIPMINFVNDLIFQYVKTNERAPGKPAENDYYYELYSETKKEMSDFIKKEIDTFGDVVNKEKSNNEELYNEISVEDISNSLSKIKDKIVSKPTFTKKQIANVVNKYKIDVNRILKNPQIYLDIIGYTPTNKELKDFGYKNITEYVLTDLGDTIYFGKDNDVDSMSNLANFQLAYPLKYKNLSDEEWSSKIEDEKKNPTTVDNALRNFTQSESKENLMTDKVSDANAKNQTKWVKEQSKKDANYGDNMFEYQSLISKTALNKIDEQLKSSPPPPIKAKALYRGMAMKPSDYSKFMQSFKEGNSIDLPISSFSFDPTIATGFSNNVNNDNALIDKSNNQSVMIKVVNQKNEFNGFAMNANIDNADRANADEFDSGFAAWSSQQEVLMPSNNKYKVMKAEVKKMEDGRSFTVITLEQVGIKTEIKLREFIDDKETDILKKHLQYPNRLSLLYKKGEN